MPQALVLQFPSAEALPSDFPSRLPEPDYADEKRMRFIVEEGFSLSEKDAALLDSRQSTTPFCPIWRLANSG